MEHKTSGVNWRALDDSRYRLRNLNFRRQGIIVVRAMASTQCTWGGYGTEKMARHGHFRFVDVSVWQMTVHLGAVFSHQFVHGENNLTRILPARLHCQ